MPASQIFDTAFGRIQLVGGLSSERARPVLLAIRGLFLRPDYLEWLIDELAPEADVLLAHLPGLHTPTLTRSDVATITAGFAQALRQAAPDRDVVLTGISAGCLPALGLAREPMVRRLVLVEPFLDVRRCWALREFVALKAPKDSLARAWLETYLGPGIAGDFSDLAACAPPSTVVLVGEEPLDPPRPLNALPSLASEAERAVWRGLPGVELAVCRDVGHDIVGAARAELLATLRRVLAETRLAA